MLLFSVQEAMTYRRKVKVLASCDIVFFDLIQMAKRKNVLVVRLSEAYTSKTCTSCGHVHTKLGGAKVFKCPSCGTEIARDVNGARNIMLRALRAVAFTVTSDAILNLNGSD